MTKEYLESLGVTYQADSLYTNEDLQNTKTIKNVLVVQNKRNLKK